MPYITLYDQLIDIFTEPLSSIFDGSLGTKTGMFDLYAPTEGSV